MNQIKYEDKIDISKQIRNASKMSERDFRNIIASTSTIITNVPVLVIIISQWPRC